MINFNGKLIASSANVLVTNRGFLYGDGIFETLKIVDDKILFFEDHYFRLMASMRIVRMEIPMYFTMDYLEEQILELAKTNGCSYSSRVRITVYRNSGGYYLPENNTVSFVIDVKPLENQMYKINHHHYEVDLYKDFYVTKQLLSSIKSTNKMINITGSIFANENGYANCLLMNEDKNVIEALNGNLFMLLDNKLTTPPLSEGCLNGVMRKQIIRLSKKIQAIETIEAIVSAFDLQKADELFITNVVAGIQPITKYRKKEFGNELANDLLVKLNALIGLG